MQKHKTQLQWAKQRLLLDGEVSRNAALQNYITRLGALINTLSKEGWRIEGEYVKTEHGKDFVYYLKNAPLKQVEYRTEDGRVVATKWEKV